MGARFHSIVCYPQMFEQLATLILNKVRYAYGKYDTNHCW